MLEGDKSASPPVPNQRGAAMSPRASGELKEAEELDACLVVVTPKRFS